MVEVRGVEVLQLEDSGARLLLVPTITVPVLPTSLNIFLRQPQRRAINQQESSKVQRDEDDDCGERK